tara:strand:- start:2461 stop:2631 length:171 start_codon:yes stop_codon:yes gene_type:complete
MQIGDLVTLVVNNSVYDEALVGIIIQQVGVSDRWFVQWGCGTVMGHNGYTLEAICS